MQETIVVAYHEAEHSATVLKWMEAQVASDIIAVHFTPEDSPMLSNMATVVGAKRVYVIEAQPERIDDLNFRAQKLIAIALKECASVIAVDTALSEVIRDNLEVKNKIIIVSPEAQL